ncbi:hypothetical protein Pmani_031006 [Petrolisthes manimaculis]|uniref:Uncharacterized protein n=1 Tax=Petrolisthes manimaculis TaxID=1843537 RepID=A0AAE1NUS1_9EUCA|nr:hypothetical protein Pmani_031006 [Petrolisthes manimaculis]
MAPRTPLTKHQKLHILRQFNSGKAGVCGMALRDKISKTELHGILEDQELSRGTTLDIIMEENESQEECGLEKKLEEAAIFKPKEETMANEGMEEAKEYNEEEEEEGGMQQKKSEQMEKVMEKPAKETVKEKLKKGMQNVKSVMGRVVERKGRVKGTDNNMEKVTKNLETTVIKKGTVKKISGIWTERGREQRVTEKGTTVKVIEKVTEKVSEKKVIEKRTGKVIIREQRIESLVSLANRTPHTSRFKKEVAGSPHTHHYFRDKKVFTPNSKFQEMNGNSKTPLRRVSWNLSQIETFSHTTPNPRQKPTTQREHCEGSLSKTVRLYHSTPVPKQKPALTSILQSKEKPTTRSESCQPIPSHNTVQSPSTLQTTLKSARRKLYKLNSSQKDTSNSSLPMTSQQSTRGKQSELNPVYKRPINPSLSLAKQNPSRDELITAVSTVRRVVQNSVSMPRWFTFILDKMLYDQHNPPDLADKLESWPDCTSLSQSRCDVHSMPGGSDILPALLTIRRTLHHHQPPAWFTFTMERILQDYRNRRPATSPPRG